MVVLVLLEGGVAQVAPEHGRHAQLVRDLEGLRDLDDLARGLVGAEVDRGAHGDGAHVLRLLDRSEEDLVELVRVGQELVVVELEQERDPVCVLARDAAEDAERRGDGVAAALHRELDDVLGVEEERVLRERGARGVLDALVDGQDRDVAGASEAAVVDERLQRAQDGRRAVRAAVDLIDPLGTGQVEARLGDALAGVVEQAAGVLAQVLLDLPDAGGAWACSCFARLLGQLTRSALCRSSATRAARSSASFAAGARER